MRETVKVSQYSCTSVVLYLCPSVSIIRFLTLFIPASETTDFYREGVISPPPPKRFASREAQNAQKLMPLHTHEILVICGLEKKRALIFVDKCGRGREIKNSEKCINLLKSAYCAKNENFSPFFTIRTKMALARPILKLDL